MIAPSVVCRTCVMDNSDPSISFDSSGMCDHCSRFNQQVKLRWHPDDASRRKLMAQVKELRAQSRHRDFDSILGLSGGVDSSYMLHVMVREFDMHPLVFHVDGGWNTKIAVENIVRLTNKLGVDLHTQVINWNEMRNFQLAMFKSGTPYLDIPQDHAFIATLYQYAERHQIPVILNGGNVSTEVVHPPKEFYYYGTDMKFIRVVLDRFGTDAMRTFPFSSVFRHKIFLPFFKHVRVLKPLDLLPYTKKDAIATLESEYGWTSYGQKHFESRFTAFFEGYWLPKRFGFDIRRCQFSSLILTGQMTREEALEELKSPALDENTAEKEAAFVAAKLDIGLEELRGYRDAPKRFYWDYPNQEWAIDLGARMLGALGGDRTTRR